VILPGGPYRIYLATRPVDFRKQHAGLSLIVQEVLGRDPLSGTVFVFRFRRGDQMKCLVWDQTGLVFAIGLERMATRWLTLQEAGGRRLPMAEAGGRDDPVVTGAVLGAVRGH
jgi:transposase